MYSHLSPRLGQHDDRRTWRIEGHILQGLLPLVHRARRVRLSAQRTRPHRVRHGTTRPTAGFGRKVENTADPTGENVSAEKDPPE